MKAQSDHEWLVDLIVVLCACSWRGLEPWTCSTPSSLQNPNGGRHDRSSAWGHVTPSDLELPKHSSKLTRTNRAVPSDASKFRHPPTPETKPATEQPSAEKHGTLRTKTPTCFLPLLGFGRQRCQPNSWDLRRNFNFLLNCRGYNFIVGIAQVNKCHRYWSIDMHKMLALPQLKYKNNTKNRWMNNL